MTLSVSTQVSPVGSKLVVDTNASSTAQTNVTGAAGTIYMIEIDNTNNADNACYFKIYNTASPTIGTTAPDHIIMVPTSQSRSIVIPDGLDFTALSYAAVISGGTAGTTSPTSAVTVRMVTS